MAVTPNLGQESRDWQAGFSTIPGSPSAKTDSSENRNFSTGHTLLFAPRPARHTAGTPCARQAGSTHTHTNNATLTRSLSVAAAWILGKAGG